RTVLQPDRTPPPYEADPLNLTLPQGATIAIPNSQVQNFAFSSRYGTPISVVSEPLPDKVTRRYVFTGGLTVNVDARQGQGEREFATDEAVVWGRGLARGNILGRFPSPPPHPKLT